MLDDQQKQSVMLNGLIADRHAFGLVLKSLIRKSNLSEAEVLAEFNASLDDEIATLRQSSLYKNEIIVRIQELFR